MPSRHGRSSRKNEGGRGGMNWKEAMQKVEDDLNEAYKHINEVMYNCDLDWAEVEKVNEIRKGITKTGVVLVDILIHIENERAE